MSRKKTQNPDIKTIAEAAGVSTATVSRALNHHPYVSKERLEKILAVAKSLGYAPMVSSRKNLFGILVSGGAGYAFAPYQSQVFQAISQALFQAGGKIELFSRETFPYILKNTFSGVIVFSGKDAEFFRRSGIPCVVINDPSATTWSICSDHAESIQIAMEYLKKLHHERIGYIGATHANWGSLERRRSFLTAAGANKDLTATFENPVRDIPGAVEQLLAKKITALIVEGEGNGLIADRALKDLHVQLPQDLSLVTFENRECSPFLTPAHTTVCQDFAEIGRCAAQTLIQIALHPEETGALPRLQIVHNHLIERESCRAAKPHVNS